MRCTLTLCLALLGAFWRGPGQAQGLQVTYLANEGVLLTAGDMQVAIDGLHRPYRPAYAVLPSEERTRFETAQPPYADLDVVLVSHVHGDHFSAEAVGQHLRHNPGAVLLASEQVVDSLAQRDEAFAAIRKQIRTVSPPWKTRAVVDTLGVGITVLGLRHGSERFRWVQNLGHLITLGGKTLLHIGDADMTVENFASFRLPDAGIDIAFIPYWFLLNADGRRLITHHIQPKQIIAVHVPPKEASQVTRQIHTHFPKALVFTKMLSVYTF